MTRVSVLIPEDQSFDPFQGNFDLSGDGSLLVYSGVGDEGQSQLWARRWDALEATPIPDTRNAFYPAISPDAGEVAFHFGNSIRVVSLQGGGSRTLTDVASSFNNTPRWSPDGAWIYYTDSPGGLKRVPAGGAGAPEIVTEVDAAAGDERHMSVDVLPGGKSAVYTAYVDFSSNAGTIQVVDLETGEVKELTTGHYPRYSTGYLLFQDDESALLAVPFDVEKLELTGTPLPVAEALLSIQGNPGSFAVSQTGRLVYRTGAGRLVTPEWIGRDGTAREIDPGWRGLGANPALSSLALSPDGARLAISILGLEGRWDLWVKQLDMGPLSPVTFEGADNRRATWSADGQSLTFMSDRAGQGDLWTKRWDGTGTAELVLDRTTGVAEGLYSPDEAWLIFREGADEEADIYAKRLGTDSVVPLVVTDFQERTVSLSPNGRWLAYVSNRSGREEVYVRPFPPDAGWNLVTVSANGGVEPVWAHSGRELFYRNGANELVAVQFTEDPTFTPGQEDVLFSMGDYLRSQGRPMYDVRPDDQSFVMLRISEQAAATELIWVENWAEELRERVGN